MKTLPIRIYWMHLKQGSEENSHPQTLLSKQTNKK